MNVECKLTNLDTGESASFPMNTFQNEGLNIALNTIFGNNAQYEYWSRANLISAGRLEIKVFSATNPGGRAITGASIDENHPKVLGGTVVLASTFAAAEDHNNISSIEFRYRRANSADKTTLWKTAKASWSGLPSSNIFSLLTGNRYQLSWAIRCEIDVTASNDATSFPYTGAPENNVLVFQDTGLRLVRKLFGLNTEKVLDTAATNSNWRILYFGRNPSDPNQPPPGEEPSTAWIYRNEQSIIKSNKISFATENSNELINVRFLIPAIADSGLFGARHFVLGYLDNANKFHTLAVHYSADVGPRSVPDTAESSIKFKLVAAA